MLVYVGSEILVVLAFFSAMRPFATIPVKRIFASLNSSQKRWRLRWQQCFETGNKNPGPPGSVFYCHVYREK